MVIERVLEFVLKLGFFLGGGGFVQHQNYACIMSLSLSFFGLARRQYGHVYSCVVHSVNSVLLLSGLLILQNTLNSFRYRLKFPNQYCYCYSHPIIEIIGKI
jgi:hypothetical protein